MNSIRLLLLVAASLAASTVVSAQTLLVSGKSVTSISPAKGASVNYAIDVSETCTLQFNLSGGTGNADLYYNFGKQPTTTTYALRSANANNTETITVPSAGAGRHYLTVYGATATSKAVLEAVRIYPLVPGATTKVTLLSSESALASITVPKLSGLAAGEFGANFGLEFRVGVAASCYLGRKPSVSASDYETAFSGNRSLPETGKVLDTTVEATTYYARLVNTTVLSLSGSLVADFKALKVIPQKSGTGPSASVDNYFVCHGRMDSAGSFSTLTDLLSKKVGGTARFFRVDWSGAAAANYPSSFGLQGSRFIKPAGVALKNLVIDQKGVGASRSTVWGHSWGSYVSSEFARANSASVKALVGLDPAETISLAFLVGNVYSNPNLSEKASASFALVTTPGLYGGDSEADTANLSVRISLTDVATKKQITDDGVLHGMPIRCMEYSLAKADNVSKALVASALNTTGKILSRNSAPDATLTGWANKNAATYDHHGALVNGAVTTNP